MTKKVFVSINNPEQWLAYEEEKIEGFHYEFASREDLYDYTVTTGELFSQKLELVEGVVQWCAEEEDYISEYRIVKEC